MDSTQISASTAESHTQAAAASRPAFGGFDSTPNARSQSMTWAEGPHTHGALNQRPLEPYAYTVGVSEDVGARRTMEDAYSFVVDYAGIRGQGYFAIFDGHAGKHAAEWCGQHFHEVMLQQLLAAPDALLPDTIAATFQAVDNELSRMAEEGTTHSGCTAVTAFLRLEDANGKQSFAPPLSQLVHSTSAVSVHSKASSDSPRSGTPTSMSGSSKRDKVMSIFSKVSGSGSSSKGTKATSVESDKLAHTAPAAIEPVGATRRVLYTANAGDARAVLCRSGKAIRLTYDHKGSDKAEVQRIQEAGGFVLNNRVNGVLAVTRSLGDTAMKEFVVGSPYTSEMELSEADEFLIIACDGLWDVVEDQAAVELIKDCKDAQAASTILLRHALDNFSHDNVTVMVVKLNVTPKEASDSS